jgi:anti-sigma-K factor RskA
MSLSLEKWNLEDELRAALRREPAPRDFAAGVLAQTVSKARMPLWRRPAMLALAAVIVLAALIPSASFEYHRREQRRALEARDQLMTALSITKVQLRQAKEKIRVNTRRTL